MAEGEVSGVVDLALHLVTAGLGIAAAALFFWTYREFGAGKLSNFVRYSFFGVVLFALEQIFEEALVFASWLEPAEFWVEHALVVFGFAFFALGALELYELSRKVGAD